MTADLNRLTKAELIDRIIHPPLDAETVALGQCRAAVDPLLTRRWDSVAGKWVIDTDAVERVIRHLAIRFDIPITIDRGPTYDD